MSQGEQKEERFLSKTPRLALPSQSTFPHSRNSSTTKDSTVLGVGRCRADANSRHQHPGGLSLPQVTTAMTDGSKWSQEPSAGGSAGRELGAGNETKRFGFTFQYFHSVLPSVQVGLQ